MSGVVIVYHSASGRTEAIARAVARGAGDGARLMAVSSIDVDVLADADAIVFGCPTYMGSASAAFKAFMDDTAAVWALQGWRDKLAAGFTHSAAPSGDKLGTLVQLATFAAQHGMVWVGLGLPPSYASTGDPGDDTNRLGSHLGLMAQTRPGAALHAGDLRTAEGFGRRIADAAARWGRPAARVESARHPAAAHWKMPPVRPGRLNLLELGSRRERFEHHLVPVATIGGAQLELAVASEPVYFAHINVSDEYAVALPTGDELVDRFPLRTFVSRGGEDVARYNHRVGDVVLHPVGLSHWPGRMRPPYELPAFPEAMRRTGLTLVYCATAPTPSSGVIVPVAAGDDRAKAYVTPAPPLSIVSIFETLGLVAAVGSTTLEVIDSPRELPLGGWIVVLEGERRLDVLRVPEGGRAEGFTRALLFSSREAGPDPIPPAWHSLPAPPFPPLRASDERDSSYQHGTLSITAKSDSLAIVTIDNTHAEIPRFWAARALYRLALHGLRLNHVSTYGGLTFTDHHDLTISIPGASITIPRSSALAIIESLYRAIAPPNYTER